MTRHQDLILLIGAVPLVEAGCGRQSKASGHGAYAPTARWALGVERERIIERTRARRLSTKRCCVFLSRIIVLDSNLHSLSRQLIELRIEHADLDATIDRLAEVDSRDEVLLQRLKKRRLALRDALARLERLLEPQEPA